MKTDSIVFDLDGTLWDSIGGIAASWNEALAEHFPDVPRRLSAEDVQAVLGKTIPEIGRIFFPGLAQARIEEIMAYCCEAESEYLAVHGGRLYPGVERTLEMLYARYRLFIVSNCHASYIPWPTASAVFLRTTSATAAPRRPRASRSGCCAGATACAAPSTSGTRRATRAQRTVPACPLYTPPTALAKRTNTNTESNGLRTFRGCACPDLRRRTAPGLFSFARQ